MTETKICGLSEPAGVAAALAGGARYLGFVFFPRSPRHVEPARAGALAAPARGRADTVAVTVDADDALLAAIAAALAPDWIQLHGNEPPARVAAVRRFAGKGVIKALPIARAEDFADAARFADADRLLFDAKAPPGAQLPGGNGAAFDWGLLRGRTVPRPWLLSGGLTPDNVAEALRESGAGAVDVSSGVESAPGVKDPARILRFLDAARSA
ncbi:MAG: phosphoribosylanthranilate isomerase [Hyphomonadaceae bacterium]|nr:phosphoribosylanthranilate isomerase [Hyphomonadaceae bacterium]